jgi:hypothetical protein
MLAFSTTPSTRGACRGWANRIGRTKGKVVRFVGYLKGSFVPFVASMRQLGFAPALDHGSPFSGSGH